MLARLALLILCCFPAQDDDYIPARFTDSDIPVDAKWLDEGDRWESATIIHSFHNEYKDIDQTRIYFWTRDAFGEMQPAANVNMSVMDVHIECYETYWECYWYDHYSRVHRRVFVPYLTETFCDARWYVLEWPSCTREMGGFKDLE